jgi:hypothetical protein
MNKKDKIRAKMAKKTGKKVAKKPVAKKAKKVAKKPVAKKAKKVAKKAKRVAEKGAKFATREEWLTAAALAMRPLFDEQGAADYPKFRVSCGWPKGARGKAIGQAWHPTSSGDATAELFISPSLEKLTNYGVVDTLLHELIHAVVGNEAGHKGPFRKLAKAIGLSGKMTATFAEGELETRLLELTGSLGPYPHAELSKLSVTKQGTRMRKVQCPGCGCILRMTAKWMEEAGIPTCGCGEPMEEA